MKLQTNKIRLLVIDIDGTLLNRSHEVPQENIQAVRRVQKELGVKIALASGRDYKELIRFARDLKMDEYGGFLIGNNGQEYYNLQTKAEYKANPMPLSVTHHVVQYAKIHDLECYGKCDDEHFYYAPEKGIRSHPDRMMEHIELAETLCCAKMGMYPTPGCGLHFEVADELRQLLKDTAEVVVADPTCIEFMPRGIDKVVGVNRACADMGYQKEEVLVIGDGQNDYLMACNYPFVAMENGFELLKEKAIRVTLSNDECGVAYEINRTFFEGGY